MRKSEIKQDFLLCDKCNYKYKKEVSLEKHMVTKHEYKECNSKFSSFMELLKHIAKDHFRNSKEEMDGKVQSEDFMDEDKKEVNEKDKQFVFSESMLDKFLE